MNSNIQNMRSSYSYLKIKRFVGDEENDYLEREEEEEEEGENMEGQKSNFEVKIENEKKRKKKEVGDGFSGSSGIDDFCCVVEKCEADLRLCKNYHQRHRVCELHAKAPSVMVGGFMQRFCQQCSRFHELSEFDQTKRSCRRRLASHNERRRKSSLESCEDSSRSQI